MSDAVVAPIWICANLLLLYASWRWARHLFPDGRILDVLGHTILLSWASITLVATLLSLAFLLSGPSLLAGTAGLSCVSILYLLRRPASRLPNLLPASTEDRAWLCFWCLLIGFWIGKAFTFGLWKHPDDWDTLNYHLPLVDHWLQSRSLLARDSNQWTSPGNNELLALWATAPFSGDFLASLNNLPITILFACSAISLGRVIGLPTTFAHLNAVALTTNFIVLIQLTNNQNDVATAACFIAAVHYILRFVLCGDRASLYMAGIALGLLAGVKFYALGYAALAYGVFAVLAVGMKDRRKAQHALLVGMAGLIIWGGFWYLRNLALTGSPVYPKEFFSATDTHQKFYPEPGFTSFFGNGRPELLSLYVKAIWKYGGPCQTASFLAVPFTSAWLLGSAVWLLWRTARLNDAVWTRLVLLLSIGGTACLLGITPFAVENDPGTLNQLIWGYCPARYSMCFLSMTTTACTFVLYDLAAGCGYLLKLLRTDRPALAGLTHGAASGLYLVLVVAAMAAVAYQIVLLNQRSRIDHWFCWLSGVLLMLVYMTASTLNASWPRLWIGTAVGSLAPALLGAALVCDSLSSHWHSGFDAYYQNILGVANLEFVKSPAENPSNICVMDSRYYPYFGSRRQYRVCLPVYVPSSEWIMEYLEREQVDFIVHRKRPLDGIRRRYGAALSIYTDYPSQFRVVYENDVLVVHEYRRQY
jgi:hypothetical protein